MEDWAVFGSMSSSEEPESGTWYMVPEFLAIGRVSGVSTTLQVSCGSWVKVMLVLSTL